MPRIKITDLPDSVELTTDDCRALHGGSAIYDYPGEYAQRFDGVDASGTAVGGNQAITVGGSRSLAVGGF